MYKCVYIYIYIYTYIYIYPHLYETDRPSRPLPAQLPHGEAIWAFDDTAGFMEALGFRV